MKIIKRDGHVVDYMPEKIENAIMKANKPNTASIVCVLIRISNNNLIFSIFKDGKNNFLNEVNNNNIVYFTG